MASVNLTGTLLNPEGEPDEGAIVKFTLLTTTGSTVSTSKSQLEVPQNGLYDIDIVYGNLRVDYVNEDGTTRFVAIVTVNSDTVATSLPELLNANVPPTDAQLLQFQAILADAVTAESGAVAAKNAAEAALAAIPTYGTAATRDITTSKDDTTAGRLTKVGDFGLGGVSITSLANADDATIGSFQSSGQLTESTAIAANFPSLGVTGTTPVWWNVFSYAGATTRASQEATECFAITTGALLNVPRKFLRNQQDNNWDDWVEVLTTGNTNLNKFEGAAAEICATGHAASGTSAWFFFDIFKNTDPAGITTIGTFDIYRNATLVQAGVALLFSNISSKRKALVTVTGLSGLTTNENLQLRFASTASIEF